MPRKRKAAQPGPVMVRQTDDRQVELFLNYALAITAEK